MEIKKQTPERMLIMPSIADRLQYIPFLGFAILIGWGAIKWLEEGSLVLGVLALAGSVALGLHSLSRTTVHGKKCLIDKAAQTLELEDRYFLFISSRHNIPFSAITSVETDYDPGDVEYSSPSYRLLICTRDKKLKLDFAFSKDHIDHLAGAISVFLGVPIQH